jgi:hypothetical protein
VTYNDNHSELRFVQLHIRVVNNRLTGQQTTKEICEAEGMTVEQYWSLALSEEMDAASFEQFLCQGFFSPKCENQYFLRLHIRRALRLALESGQAWIRKCADDKLILEPREATKWLLSKPRRDHVVPPELREYFETKDPSADAPSASTQRCATPTNEASKSVRKVSRLELDRFVNEHSDGEKTEDQVKVQATIHFVPRTFPRSRWREAWRQCRKKRLPGDKRASNTPA